MPLEPNRMIMTAVLATTCAAGPHQWLILISGALLCRAVRCTVQGQHADGLITWSGGCNVALEFAS
jgi:hypothetical protein